MRSRWLPVWLPEHGLELDHATTDETASTGDAGGHMPAQAMMAHPPQSPCRKLVQSSVPSVGGSTSTRPHPPALYAHHRAGW